MNASARMFLVLGTLNAALAVALGAFGAHVLTARLAPELLAVFQTGVQYHIYHALGLVLVGLVAGRRPASSWPQLAGGAMIAGIVLFSGSLYALALTGLREFGTVAPFGGAAFIVAWILFAVAVLRGVEG